MKRHLGYVVGCALILLAASALRILDPAPVAQFRLLVFDMFQRVSPREFDADSPVRIVDIDDESIRRLGQWPWPRTVIAQLIDGLKTRGAAAIGFDVVFSEPDRSSPENSLKFLPQTDATEEIRRIAAAIPPFDTVFADALADAPVVLGLVLNNNADGELPPDKAGFATAGDDPRHFLTSFAGGLRNLTVLEGPAQGMGALNWVPDSDQVIRRIPLLLQAGGRIFPALSMETLRVAQGASTYIVKASNASGEQAYGAQTGIVSIKVGAIEIPTDGEGQLWLKFTPTEPRRFIPAWRVLENQVDAAEIEGRIILVGTSAAGLFDLRSTPLDPSIPGVEVHAQALEQILAGTSLLRPDYALALELGYMLVVGIALAVVILVLGAEWSAAMGVASVATVVVASWYLFREYGLLLDPMYPSIVAVAIYVFGTLSVYLRSEMERRRVRGAFSRYISPELVNRLADDPGKLVLGGEMRDMSIMFSDIRGFTSISEGMNAQELTGFVNSFLTPMTDIILAHKGTIDKYMGDCIMAFWNAPIDDADHARNAARSALDMVKGLATLNATIETAAAAAGRPFQPVRIGIGIATGEACVGNMGSDRRFDYSVIGDNVNISSRLEGQSKAYGVTVVVAEPTVEQAPELAWLELDLISVKGKARAVRIYTLMGDEMRARDQAFQDLLATHDQMLADYRAKRWDQAEAAIVRCRSLAGDDLSGLYDLYAERIAEFRQSPPPADWDGVYVATTK
jgi:adenylate cyclase